MNPIKKVLGCFRKADNDYHMIEDGDRIAVGVSGGKDSSCLIHCLHPEYAEGIEDSSFIRLLRKMK